MSCWCCGNILVFNTRGGWVASLNPFIVMTNILSMNSVKTCTKTPMFYTKMLRIPYPTFGKETFTLHIINNNRDKIPLKRISACCLFIMVNFLCPLLHLIRLTAFRKAWFTPSEGESSITCRISQKM